MIIKKLYFYKIGLFLYFNDKIYVLDLKIENMRKFIDILYTYNVIIVDLYNIFGQKGYVYLICLKFIDIFFII